MSILATGVMQVNFSTVSSFAGNSINAVDHLLAAYWLGRLWSGLEYEPLVLKRDRKVTVNPADDRTRGKLEDDM